MGNLVELCAASDHPEVHAALKRAGWSPPPKQYPHWPWRHDSQCYVPGSDGCDVRDATLEDVEPHHESAVALEMLKALWANGYEIDGEPGACEIVKKHTERVGCGCCDYEVSDYFADGPELEPMLLAAVESLPRGGE